MKILSLILIKYIPLKKNFFITSIIKLFCNNVKFILFNYKIKLHLLTIPILLTSIFITSCSMEQDEILLQGKDGNNIYHPESTPKYQISQYGITWTFDKEYETGQFANGDWWVVGPVTITSITKPHKQNGLDGSMINPTGCKNGYDNRHIDGYDSSLDVSRSLPFTLNINQSLVSTISWAVGDPGCPELISNPAPAKPRPLLKIAAILTCLDSAPSEGSLRPAYSGDIKILYNISQIQWSILPNLNPVTNTPTLSEYEEFFYGPWIDHGTSYAFDEYLHPSNNYAVGSSYGYGREIAWRYNDACLLMMINKYSQSEKEQLMFKLLQFGIDTYWAAVNGAYWMANGGHASGRKWPILFAGLMLNDDDMKSVGTKTHTLTSWRFGEDEQTFYIDQAEVNLHLSTGGYTSSDIGIAEWGIRHFSEPNRDDSRWDDISDNRGQGYRQHTASAWVGATLGVHLLDKKNPTLNVKSLWNHDAFFDYQDRYMNTETGTYRSMTDFSEDMWDAYR